MLRLHLAELLPWVDTKGNVRIPDEEFPLLDHEARSEVRRLTNQFAAWKVGVLTDAWEHPSYAKPIQVGAGDEESAVVATGYALGEEADSYFAELKPLLLSVIRFIRQDYWTERWLFADAFWNPTGRSANPIRESLMNFGEAVEYGLVNARGMVIHQVPQSKMFTARLTQDAADTLLTSWWPSSAHGFLAAIMTEPGFTSAADRAFNQTGTLGREGLEQVGCILRVSKSFDHLGFSILSRAVSWHHVREQFAARGWFDGKPIELLGPLE